jgi:GT2 family glycosyltransferase
MSRVSAIVVNYNAGEILKEAVNSLLCSATVGKVFVVDNCSTDHSMDDIEHIAVLHSQLICICNKTNLGFAKACNMAISIADENDDLLFLNPDCIMNPDALETMMACLKSIPRAAMVGPLLLNPDRTEQAGGRRAVPTPWRSFVRAFGLSRLRDLYPRLFSDFLLHQQPLPESPIEVEAISGSCMLVRRAALEDIGLLDEGYFLHCEDLDWCMRFRQNEWKIMFVPEADVIHYKGTCSQARPIFVEWHKHKGMMRFYRKFFRHQYPGILLWIVGIGVWLRFSAVAVLYSVRHIRHWLKHDRL